MGNGFEYYSAVNEAVRERMALARSRMAEMEQEETVSPPYRDYFQKVSRFLRLLFLTAEQLEDGSYYLMTLSELQQSNRALYKDIAHEYETSYANPEFACKALGAEYGRFFSVLSVALRRGIAYIFAGNLSLFTELAELFIEIYNLFEGEVPELTELKSVLYYFKKDYCAEELEFSERQNFETDYVSGLDFVEQADLSHPEYLYFFGKYVSENELRVADFLRRLPDAEIEAMAHTYTNGYRKGFAAYRIDLSSKKTVAVRCQLGFERMMRAAVRQFREMGLSGTLLISSTEPNRQYSFDHRFDKALYFDQSYAERYLTELRKFYETRKEAAAVYAGPAVQMVFGETPFEPVRKPEAPVLSEKQQELDVRFRAKLRMTIEDFIKSEETSFTIIAYPVPEIGPEFENIFAETVKVNTLDSDLYQKMQQQLIDALDQGVYVHIVGKAPNRTDLKVYLHPLSDPLKQTNFENCIDDVNIPVGEVFTSPQLAGTEGILHVSEVYLRDLRFRNLELRFEDGMIREYHCTNFGKEEDNQAFLKENLLNNHETLPIGEFAIGTNTTAYTMGRRYQIQDKLPILIAEKTGPHFAVGDTCYSRSEDRAVYNPDGKEIIARDNECSLLRSCEPEKAYYNCHTDITIPYNELQEITVFQADGSGIPLISDGRFVLPGTEELNRALESMI